MRPWGCPNGHAESLVADTAHDAEGYMVRHRRCQVCHVFWTTQEVPIEANSYWKRAYSRNQSRLVLAHKQVRSCHKCGESYKSGSYSLHVETERHDAALMASERNRLNARRYAREWAQKRAILERAQ